MSETKIDITSTVVEKSIDAAKSFLSTLLKGTIEEVGLLIKDNVTMWRYKNQVKMLIKAKEYCDKNKIAPRVVSFKVLCPLLEYSSLEDDEHMQERWSNLLGNMVDSQQNIENHVFPYILSQISKNELQLLIDAHSIGQAEINKVKQDHKLYIEQNPATIEEMAKRLSEIETLLSLNYESLSDEKKDELLHEGLNLRRDISSKKARESTLDDILKRPYRMPNAKLKEYEVANLTRLGLIKEEHDTLAFANSIDLDNSRRIQDVSVRVGTMKWLVLTELAHLFIMACSEK